MRRVFIFFVLIFYWSVSLYPQAPVEGPTEQETAGAFRAVQQEKAAKAAAASKKIAKEQEEIQKAKPLPSTPTEKEKALEKVKTQKEKSQDLVKDAEAQVGVIKDAQRALKEAKKKGDEKTIADAKVKLEDANKKLMEMEAKSVGKQAFDPNEGGPIDKAMNRAGLWLANKFPGLTSKLTLMSIKTNVAGNNFGPFRKLDEKCADFSERVQNAFSLNKTFRVSDRELNAEFEKDANRREFELGLGQKVGLEMQKKSVQDGIKKRIEQSRKKLKTGESLDEKRIAAEVESEVRASLYKSAEDAYKKNLRTALISERMGTFRDDQLSSIVSDKDVDNEFKKKKHQEKFQQMVAEEMKEPTVQRDVKKRMDAAIKKLRKKGKDVEPEKVNEIRAQVEADVEKALKKKLEKKYKSTIRSSLASAAVEARTEKKVKGLKKGKLKQEAKDLEEQHKELSKDEAEAYRNSLMGTAKRAGWSDEVAEKALKNPDSDEFKRLMVYHKIREDIVEEAKKTVKEKVWASLTDMHDGRDFCASKKGWALVGVFSLVTAMTTVVGGIITSKIKAEAANSSGWDMISKGQTLEGEEINLDSGESVSKEEYAKLGLTTEVMKYYETFHEKFKESLKTIDYYSKSFNVVQKITYQKDSTAAGVSVLFNYTGSGDIATGLVPVVIKAYPTHILGQFLSQRELLSSITNKDGLELMGTLLRNAPEVIFFLRVIALLNTANNKFTNVDERIKFLNEAVRLLYIRLIRTVDSVTTTNLNAFQSDEKKWETIYMKTPAQCFKNAPQVIRDFVAEVKVDVKPTQGSVETQLSLEEYLINQFEIFDKLRSVKFEGDVGFSVPEGQLDDNQVEDYLFALFIRVLNEVSKLEEIFVVKTDPVSIVDEKGVVKQIVGKSLFENIISAKLKAFKIAQNKFIDAAMDFAGDPTNAEVEKAFKDAEGTLEKASSALENVTLEFRKTLSFYLYERTLGYKPERILDVIKRETKRAYQNAKNKENFAGIFSKVYGLFAKSFPISENDLLVYAQNSETIKSPVKILGAGVSQ